MTAQYAVIGAPIQHSLSPMLHAYFSAQTGRDIAYERVLMDDVCFETQVYDFFRAGGAGLNVTAPAKMRAFLMAVSRTPRCDAAGAANTLWLDEAGLLCADNTDGVGLVRDLVRRIDLCGARILVVGAGGAVRGILPALEQTNPAKIVLANRSPVCSYQNYTWCLLGDVAGPYDLIINATPAGAFDFNVRGAFCYDLNYSASGITPFVAWASEQGASAVDGFGMLVEQAAEAFFVWHGVRPLSEKTAQDSLLELEHLRNQA
jgi:shikimate dehydrogenase